MIQDIPLAVVITELVIFAILGIVGNALVIAVYIRQKHAHSAVIFILTLAVTDFITCLVTIPFTIVTLSVSFKLRYDFFCKLYFFLITSAVPFSAFIMTAIAVDRFLCIVGPFRFRFNVMGSRILVIGLAFLAGTSGIITSLLYGVRPDRSVEGMWFDGLCTTVNDHISPEGANVWDNIYSSLYVICGVLVIILYAIIYTYVISNHKLQALVGGYSTRPDRNNIELRTFTQPTSDQNVPLDTHATDNDNPSNDQHNAEAASDGATSGARRSHAPLSPRKHIQFGLMLSVVAFVYIICFSPAWLMFLRIVEFKPLLFYLYFSYHVTNPVIYSLMSKSFRKKLVRQCCGRSRERNGSALSLSTSA